MRKAFKRWDNTDDKFDVDDRLCVDDTFDGANTCGVDDAFGCLLRGNSMLRATAIERLQAKPKWPPNLAIVLSSDVVTRGMILQI